MQAAMPATAKNEVALPGVTHPVLSLLTFLPITIVLLILLAFFVDSTPPAALVVLLVLVIGCCAVLSWTSLQYLLGGKVRFDQDGLTVCRLFSEERYPWSAIEACKVMPATGTLGDDALVEVDERAGVGLFVKMAGRVREHALDAEVVLCAGKKSHLQPLMQVASKIDAAIKGAHAARAGRLSRSAPNPVQSSGQRLAPTSSQPSGQSTGQGTRARQFQQRPKHPAPSQSDAPAARKADPVAQFRNRAK